MIGPYLFVGFLILATGCTMEKSDASTSDSKLQESLTSTIDGAAVEIVREGFSPQTVRIKEREIVTWFNIDVTDGWPASDRHPSHTNYPADYSQPGRYGGSQACIGLGQPKEGVFDTCRGIKMGESVSITFNERGTWRYHDHLNPSLTGVVIVE